MENRQIFYYLNEKRLEVLPFSGRSSRIEAMKKKIDI